MAKYTGSLNQGRILAALIARERMGNFGVSQLPHDMRAKESVRLAIMLLTGKCIVDTVTSDGRPGHIDFNPGWYDVPRDDLSLLAIELLKNPDATDPALVAAFLDEALAQRSEPDLPVTRDWLEGFGFLLEDKGIPEEDDCWSNTDWVDGYKLFFYFPRNEGPSESWGMTRHAHQDAPHCFESTPTRRKVFAFCNATGIDLMEKS